MQLIGYQVDGVRHIGAVADNDPGKVVPLGSAVDFYRDPDTALAQATQSGLIDRDDLVAAPFVPDTARIFCVGINYHSHAEESKEAAGLDLPKFPMIFGRWQQSLVTDGEPVPLPPHEDGLDWEVELAVVIKDTVWAAGDDALDHVLGYTAFNDLSARKKQLETAQFTLGKNARSGPIGPVLVTSDQIDPAVLAVSTRVNGAQVQSGNTRGLIHDVAAIIRYITDTVTLLPGDVIATGTPGGVGIGMKPPRLLRAGDVVEVEVEGIGVLRNPIVRREEM